MSEEKRSAFRIWVHRKWDEYKRELYEMDGVITTDSPGDYFNRYKWFLKALYKDDINKL